MNFSVSDEFVLVYCVYQSHISTSLFFAPDAAPDDGLMWLLLLPGTMNRANVSKVNTNTQ